MQFGCCLLVACYIISNCRHLALLILLVLLVLPVRQLSVRCPVLRCRVLLLPECRRRFLSRLTLHGDQQAPARELSDDKSPHLDGLIQAKGAATFSSSVQQNSGHRRRARSH